jgi:hypothetical protein
MAGGAQRPPAPRGLLQLPDLRYTPSAVATHGHQLVHIDWMPYAKEDKLFSESNLLSMVRSRTRHHQDKELNMHHRPMTTVPLRSLRLGLRHGLSNETILALGELRWLGLAVTVESPVKQFLFRSV